MEAKLLINDGKNHGDEITRGLGSADQILIMVAFLRNSGIELLSEHLIEAINNGATARIIVGLDFYLTDPKALWHLFDICERSKKTNLMLCTQEKATFHPKLYLWIKDSIASVVIGSANLTGGGLKENVELSVLHNLPKEAELVRQVQAFAKKIEDGSRVFPATRIGLSQYQRKHEIFTKKRKAAEKEAREELSKIYIFDEKKLKKYLAEYKASKEEKADLKTKSENYKKARLLLDSLVDKPIKTKEAFLKIYGQLVGEKDNGSLWHSGGLFRSKNAVADNYKKFLKMLQAVHSSINQKPETVFDVGIQHAVEIDGLGLNVLTEILNTYKPSKFAVLNRNPATSLAHLGFEEFKSFSKNSFSVEKYMRFNDLIKEIADLCEFKELSEVDHFLNYVYWAYAKPQEEKEASTKRGSRSAR